MTTGQSSESGVVGETALARRLRVLREAVEAEMAVKEAEARLAAAKAAVAAMEAAEAAVAEPIPPEPVPNFAGYGFAGPTLASRLLGAHGLPFGDVSAEPHGYICAVASGDRSGWRWVAVWFGPAAGMQMETVADLSWPEAVMWLRGRHARFLGERSVSPVALAA